MYLPYIGITMGDPTGIGPEIIVKALSEEELFKNCRPLVFGDLGALSNVIKMENLSAEIETISELPEKDFQPNKIFLFPVTRLSGLTLKLERPDKVCGEAMVKYIKEGVRWVNDGKLDAITTCPINKQAINEAGYPFSGHTELLAHLAQVSSVAMMFIGTRWKIALVTTHLPIKDVSKWITKDRVLSTIRIAEDGMKRYFAISQPKIAILGLNPHCGEDGLLGDEEKREVIPAIEEAKVQGIDVKGPFPADSFFDISKPSSFDIVIAMYHDQGLIPMKMLDFKEAVNFTLGLPFIRTSVSHGTGYDISRKGMADHRNLLKALIVASNLVKIKKIF